MSNRRIDMRKILQALRLYHDAGQSRRSIARSLGISRDAVTDYLTRAAAAKLEWPLPATIDEAALEQKLFPQLRFREVTKKPEPNWAVVHEELKRKGSTLQILHEEYLADNLEGINYSLFCRRYQVFKKSLKNHMRQTYRAGERVFMDYAGPTMPIIDRASGEERRAQIFVGVLGASNYIYAEAHWSQKLPDWIAAHVRMFEHFGGVPAVIVCDNLKSAVIKASRTEPVINAAYQNLADHYGTVILPARARKPKDKAKVENGVLITERWILFRLRKRVFGSLGELNDAIRTLLTEINLRPFQKLPGNRQTAFETIDKPALLPLPEAKFEYAEFHKVRVGLDNLIEVAGCSYSVPYVLRRREVEVRLTATTVEVIYKGERVASHARSSGNQPISDPQHMEPSHRAFGLWNAAESLEWAQQIGIHVHGFLGVLLAAARTHEHGYRATLAMKKLATEFGNERLDAACERGVEIGATAASSIRSILRNGLDMNPSEKSKAHEATFEHPNVRGATYYH
ncbi:MAG: IS21 family transposase [Gallionella sp.]